MVLLSGGLPCASPQRPCNNKGWLDAMQLEPLRYSSVHGDDTAVPVLAEGETGSSLCMFDLWWIDARGGIGTVLRRSRWARSAGGFRENYGLAARRR